MGRHWRAARCCGFFSRPGILHHAKQNRARKRVQSSLFERLMCTKVFETKKKSLVVPTELWTVAPVSHAWLHAGTHPEICTSEIANFVRFFQTARFQKEQCRSQRGLWIRGEYRGCGENNTEEKTPTLMYVSPASQLLERITFKVLINYSLSLAPRFYPY